MAVGDVKAGITSVSQNQYLDIRPAAGEEWNLRTVLHEGDVAIEFYDGSNSLIFEALLADDYVYYCHIDMTNTYRIRVKNLETSSALIGYTARQIK